MTSARNFTPIERHELNPDEPMYAVAAFVESTGDRDEFLYLSADDAAGRLDLEDSWIALSPDEARALRDVITRWLGE